MEKEFCTVQTGDKVKCYEDTSSGIEQTIKAGL